MAELSNRDFDRIARLVEGHCGIKMPAAKKLMVEGRLRRRLRVLGLDDFAAYGSLLFDQGGLDKELPHLTDCLTTNKTDFFREPAHFDYLTTKVVPEMLAQGVGIERPLRVWSSACSTGPEPYTIAMVLADIARLNTRFQFTVRASDISTDVLKTALRGIYPMDAADPIPPAIRKRYLLRSRDGQRMRIAPDLRATVGFRQLNLLDNDYPWDEPMDVIFCRNVLIYFDKPTQQAVLSFLCRHLVPGGYLMLGHSETLHGLSLPVSHAAPAVYRRSP